MHEFSIQYAVIAVVLMALITYLIRMLPIVLFQKEIKSQFFRSFLYYVPYAVLASLTFPAIFTSTGDIRTAICGTVVALVLAFLEKGLVVVAVGGILAVALAGILLQFTGM